MDDLNSVGSNEQVKKPVPNESKMRRQISSKAILIAVIAILGCGGLAWATTYYLQATVPVTVTSMTFSGTSGIAGGTCAISGLYMTCTPPTMTLGVNETLTIVINNPTAALNAYIAFNSTNVSIARIVLVSVTDSVVHNYIEPASPLLYPFVASSTFATTTIVFNIVPVAAGSATIHVSIQNP
jgi:hypothetical protein